MLNPPVVLVLSARERTKEIKMTTTDMTIAEQICALHARVLTHRHAAETYAAAYDECLSSAADQAHCQAMIAHHDRIADDAGYALLDLVS